MVFDERLGLVFLKNKSRCRIKFLLANTILARFMVSMRTWLAAIFWNSVASRTIETGLADFFWSSLDFRITGIGSADSFWSCLE